MMRIGASVLARWKSFQQHVSWLFYQHGMFCASHPFSIITIVVSIVLFMSLSLWNVPLHGTHASALRYNTPVSNYSIPPSKPGDMESSLAPDSKPPPRWYFGSPALYIQQIVVKTAILPWVQHRLIPSDAYRAAFATVFELTEHIENFRLNYNNQSNRVDDTVSMGDVCLRISEQVADSGIESGVLPQYNCLTLSPARFWKQDKLEFLSDGDILNTIFKRKAFERDLLFGVPGKLTGVKKYYLRNRQRVITYAVTVTYRKYNAEFSSALRDHLLRLYPLSIASNCSQSASSLTHIHYQSENFIVEYTPLMFAYVVLCLYVFFSVRKIEMVKSKWGLALSAWMTVMGSLIMSVSLCVFFGLEPSLSGGEIFPYLVVIIGLENVLVLTKSVASTPVHLEVKFRVAQGLQNEGWYIFKNLMTELIILAIGFFSFVPAIQEFCLFAVLGLGSDCFLQLFFFTSVLSIDIRRMELSDLGRRDVQEALRRDSSTVDSSTNQNSAFPVVRCPVMSRLYPQTNEEPSVMTRLYSAPPIGRMPGVGGLRPAGGYEPPSPPGQDRTIEGLDSADLLYMDVPERRNSSFLYKLERWSKNRILQRGIMICVILWILLLVSKTSMVDDVPKHNHHDHHRHGASTQNPHNSSSQADTRHGSPYRQESRTLGYSPASSAGEGEAAFGTSSGAHVLLHEDFETWKQLSVSHWRNLMSCYNITLLGRYITMIPSIHLSIDLTADDVIHLRHPLELQAAAYLLQQQLVWNQTVAAAADEQQSMYESVLKASNESSLLDIIIHRLLRYPRTRLESLVTLLLGVASCVLLLILLLSCYKCACSRNYARFRESWRANKRRRKRAEGQYYKQIRESLPIVLTGHTQEVECIVSSAQMIVSSCLGGSIRVWDIASGECVHSINRMRSCKKHSSSSSSLKSLLSHLPSSKPSKHSLNTPPILSNSRSSNSLNESKRVSPFSDKGGKIPAGGVGAEGAPRGGKVKKHSRHRSVDCALASLIPDLTETIDTDFTRQAAADRKMSTPLTPPPTAADTANFSSSLAATNALISSTAVPSSSPAATAAPSLTPVSTAAALSTSPAVVTSTPAAAVEHHRKLSAEVCGYDFTTQFQSYFEEHKKNWEEERAHMIRRRALRKGGSEKRRSMGGGEGSHTQHNKRKSSHGGDGGQMDLVYHQIDSGDSVRDDWRDGAIHENIDLTCPASAIWCVAVNRGVVAAGCGDGSVELWDCGSGELQCTYHRCRSGVTAVCFSGNRLVVARVDGYLDFIEFSTSSSVGLSETNASDDITDAAATAADAMFTYPSCSSPTAATHSSSTAFGSASTAAGSAGTVAGLASTAAVMMRYKLLGTVRAHHQPINVLQTREGYLITACQDHTLKVYKISEQLCLFTLHGHTGSITSVAFDTLQSLTLASGSVDSSVRLWDVESGCCLHKLTGHSSTVTSVVCSVAHVISVAMDDRLCIWDRSKGHLIRCVQMETGGCNTVALLTHHLVLTGGQGCLHLWDIDKGELLRVLPLGDQDMSVFVRQLVVIDNSLVICGYGTQLRLLRFTSVLEKDE